MRYLSLLGFLLISCSRSPTVSPTLSGRGVTTLVVTQPARKTISQGGDRFSATVEADTRLRLTFNSAGYVKRVLQLGGKSGIHTVGPGDAVKRGQILAELRTLEYRARVNESEAGLGQSLAGENDALAGVDLARGQTRQARAQVDQARAGQIQAQAGVREAEAALQSARVQIFEAQAQLNKSQADWERAEHLMQADSLTRPDYDLAKLALTSARGKLLEGQQQVVQLQAKLIEVKANVPAASARVEQALGQLDSCLAQEDRAAAGVSSARSRTSASRANVELAKVALDDVYLKAPMDGVILSRSVEAGGQVSVGTVGFEMADTRFVLVTFGVPDILVKELKLGETLRLQCEALPGSFFQGQVRTIAPEADPQSRVYKVEVRVPNPKDQLKVGMITTLDLRQKGSPSRPLLTVPLGALLPSKVQPGAYQIFVVEEGKAKLRDVKPGNLVGDQMEIVSGLEEGEQVITEGANLLTNGQSVKVKS